MLEGSSWTNAYVGEPVNVDIKTNRKSKLVDPYACAIKKQNQYFDVYDKVGHIPREISRHVYYFITAEGGTVSSGTVLSTNYRYSPIPAGGLEVPLKLRFACVRRTMKSSEK